MARDDQGRKAGRNFATLRATFSRSSVAVNEVPAREEVKKPDHEQVKTLPKPKAADKRQSRYTLFDLFSKPKVQVARGYHETGLEALQEQPPTPPPKRPAVEDTRPAIVERIEPRSSRRHIPPPLPLVLDTVSEQPQRSPQRPQQASKDNWNAPPLFQAYPQSLRHGSMQIPATSMDSLVRAQNLRKQAGFLNNGSSLPAVRETEISGAGQEGSKLSKRLSILNETPELAEKVFVLVTTGRLVQYAGEGTYDRMPERVLQLCEKSAAFACDLIPGKHWVVQVVQQVQTGMRGPQINKSRSILSRLRGPAISSNSRRAADSILLVFDSAEDMTGWLQSIRGVIEKLGGAKKKEDGEATTAEEEAATSEAGSQLSHRYRVSRPISMISTTNSAHRSHSTSSFSQPRSPVRPDGTAVPSVSNSTHLSPPHSPANSPRDTQFPAEARSLIGTTASGSSPMDSSVASSEHSRLERLRDGSRASVVSTRTTETDNMTLPTSKCSSSPPSPLAEAFDEQNVIGLATSTRSSYVAPAPIIRQLSVQPPSVPEDSEPERFVAVVTTKQPEPASLPEELMGTGAPEIQDQRIPAMPNRVSQNFSYPTPPIRLRLSQSLGRPNSEVIEPWSKRRPDSVLGQLPSISTRSLNRIDSVSQRSRPLSRMIPVVQSSAPPIRPIGPGPATFPRRYSSMPPTLGTPSFMASPRTPTPDTAAASPATTAGSPDLSFMKTTPQTHRPRMPSLPLAINPTQSSSQHTGMQGRGLRRPASVQIRSDPAPFLSQRRTSMTTKPLPPVGSSNSYFAGATPSNDFFHKVIAARGSSPNVDPPKPPEVKAPAPVSQASEPAEDDDEAVILSEALETTPPLPAVSPSRPSMRSRGSMPAMMLSGLPPPPPPPNMPLPPPPPSMASSVPPPIVPLPSMAPNARLSSVPPNVPLPMLPPGIPMPSRPPTIPLPPVPTRAA